MRGGSKQLQYSWYPPGREWEEAKIPQQWDRPVTIATGKIGRYVIIYSTERAAEYMLYEWPKSMDGKKFTAAKLALIDAHDGKISIDEARSAFIAAAEEAGIFCRQ
ncbi:DUF982 domain-containing protein [Rhizobium sp. CB3090]|uniref:DUF982 domain-containing protein n=1 Tax=Rhizobium sp. CB3090 TaxID=3039156 RepID=UPI0024B0D353|nr:DUF982 domain-containing protein [Rhizobium sp. CB3090]WFU08344.1 DUF982 domain-containing protein [Rhizobium sp. CB3090]